jgi:hypothetical protein
MMRQGLEALRSRGPKKLGSESRNPKTDGAARLIWIWNFDRRPGGDAPDVYIRRTIAAG